MVLVLANAQLALSLKAMENSKSKLKNVSIAVPVQELVLQELFLRLTNLKKIKRRCFEFLLKAPFLLSAVIFGTIRNGVCSFLSAYRVEALPQPPPDTPAVFPEALHPVSGSGPPLFSPCPVPWRPFHSEAGR